MKLHISLWLSGAAGLALSALTATSPLHAQATPPAQPAAATALPMMAAPVTPPGATQDARLITRLTALDQLRPQAAALSAQQLRHYSHRISAHHPGAAGQRITRTQHTYQGLRIFGSDTVVVNDWTGAIISTSVTDRRPGLAPNSPKGGAGATGTAAGLPARLTPTLSAQRAIALAVQSVAPQAVHRWQPTAELLLYPIVHSVRTARAADKSEADLNALDLEDVISHYELAYYVKTRMAQQRRPLYHDTIVNARTGAIIAQWQALQTSTMVTGSGNSQYNGVVAISTSQQGDTFQMLDSSRGSGGKFGGMAITNADHSSSYNPNAGEVYVNQTNTWGDGRQYNGASTRNANGQTAAVNALWGLVNTYDAHRNALGWHSLDGNNTATHIAVHVDRNYDNAFYDDRCQCMFIGDGGNYFYNLGSIDVIGHEMSHGVTAATADLVYAGESGGLNESHSDIGGEITEAYARAGGAGSVIPASGNDWMMGKEISRTAEPLRWMYKPSKDGKSADAWSSTLKDLDVHYSSGPNNRMFYFLSQGSQADAASEYYSKYLVKAPQAMTGIGNDKAYRIWFRALTTRFTSATNYAQARARMLEVAQELYGAGSKEAIAVQRAYAAVNVGADVDEALPLLPSENKTAMIGAYR
ncbi:MAG: M4 family metallopeptidase [Duganella sp.]